MYNSLSTSRSLGIAFLLFSASTLTVVDYDNSADDVTCLFVALLDERRITGKITDESRRSYVAFLVAVDLPVDIFRDGTRLRW